MGTQTQIAAGRMTSVQPVPTQLGGLSMHLNFFWTASGNIIYALSQWAMIVALAKLTTPFMVGQFALGIAISTPILRLAYLQLRAVQASDTRRQYDFSEYLGLRILMTIAALCAIGVVSGAGNQTQSTKLVILAVGVAKGVESLSDIYYGLFQLNDRLDRVGQSMMLKGILSILALALGLYFTRDVFWGVLALALGWIVVLILLDVRRSRIFLQMRREGSSTRVAPWHAAFQPRFHFERQWSLVRLAFPLGVVMALVSLNLHLPRYFVAYHLGEQQLGVFSALAYMTVAVTTLADALGAAAIPKLSRLYAESQLSEFRQLLLRLVAFGALLGTAGAAVAAFVGKQVLQVAYGPEYANYSGLFVWLMVAGGFSTAASVMTAALTASRAFRLQVPMFAGVCLANALGCWWLVPQWQLHGGAAASVIAAITHLIVAASLLLYRVQPAGERAVAARPYAMTTEFADE